MVDNIVFEPHSIRYCVRNNFESVFVKRVLPLTVSIVKYMGRIKKVRRLNMGYFKWLFSGIRVLFSFGWVKYPLFEMVLGLSICILGFVFISTVLSYLLVWWQVLIITILWLIFDFLIILHGVYRHLKWLDKEED